MPRGGGVRIFAGVSTPTGNDLVREALALMAKRLAGLGYRFTKSEIEVLRRAEAALGGEGAARRVREVPAAEGLS